MNTWHCRNCDATGEAPEGSVQHWHRCDPPPGPRRRLSLEELYPDEGDFFDQRAAVFRRMLQEMGE